MEKSREAFRTISEVAEWLDIPAHVLRFWESRFSQVKPVKRAGGRRYYRPNDMLLLGGIRRLLHDDGITIKGVQKILRERGLKHVVSLSEPLSEDTSLLALQPDDLESIQTPEPVENIFSPVVNPDPPAPAPDQAATTIQFPPRRDQETPPQAMPDHQANQGRLETAPTKAAPDNFARIAFLMGRLQNLRNRMQAEAQSG